MRFFFFAFFTLFSTLCAATPPYGAIVIDAASGRSLHERGADIVTQPASLTKMMTLLLTFKEIESGRLTWDKRLKISQRATRQAPSVLGVRPGQKLTVRQAVLALITKSANDVALVLAENIAGSEAVFVTRMNAEARRLGMRSTTFRNASGLPNARQVSTARDIARLSRNIVSSYQKYYPLFATRRFTYTGRVHKNHNKLLGKTAGGVVIDGLKTGYVNASGFSLAASAVKGKRRLIVVVLGGPDRLWRDTRVSHLFRCGFDGRFSPSSPKTRVTRAHEETMQVLNENSEIEALIHSLDLSDPVGASGTAPPSAKAYKDHKTQKAKKRRKSPPKKHVVCVSVANGRPEVLLKKMQKKIPKELLGKAFAQIKHQKIKNKKRAIVESVCHNKKHATALYDALCKGGFPNACHT